MKYRNWKDVIIRGKLNILDDPTFNEFTNSDAEQCRRFKPSLFKNVSNEEIIIFYKSLDVCKKDELERMLNDDTELKAMFEKSYKFQVQLINSLNDVKCKLNNDYPNNNIDYRFNSSGDVKWYLSKDDSIDYDFQNLLEKLGENK